MSGSGMEDLEMVTENKHGLMEQNILVSGEKIEHMEKVDSFMLMETFMMVSGLMIRLMDMVYINT